MGFGLRVLKGSRDGSHQGLGGSPPAAQRCSPVAGPRLGRSGGHRLTPMWAQSTPSARIRRWSPLLRAARLSDGGGKIGRC